MCRPGKHCERSREAKDRSNANRRASRAAKRNVIENLQENGMSKEATKAKAMTASDLKAFLEKKKIEVAGVSDLPVRNDQIQKEEKKAVSKSKTKTKTTKVEAKAEKPKKAEVKAKVEKKAKATTKPTTSQDTLFDVNEVKSEKKVTKATSTPKVAEPTAKVTKPAAVVTETPAASEVTVKKVDPQTLKKKPTVSSPVGASTAAASVASYSSYDDYDDYDRDSKYEEGFGDTGGYGYDDEEDYDPELEALLNEMDMDVEEGDFSDDDDY